MPKDKIASYASEEAQVYGRPYYAGVNSNYIFWYGNLKYRIFWNRRITVLEKFLPSGRVLDIGCAFGFFLKFIEKKFEVYGVDISGYAIQQAEKLILGSGGHLLCCDIRRGIPFKEKFDAITAFDVIEHIYDPISLFAILRNSLTEEGILYLELPLKKTLIDFDKGHYYRPLEEYLSCLGQAGFKPLLIRRYYTIGLRAIMIPAADKINYCSIVAKKDKA